MLFHPEFLETGVVRAISEALPFDSIGATTCSAAVAGAGSDLMLALTVLTSDEAVFRAGASAPIKDNNLEESMRELYSRLTPSSAEKPALLFTLAPVIDNIGGDEFVAALDMLSGGVPLFGTLAFTYRPDFSGIETCCNGERYPDALTLIAMFGKVEPEFYLTSVPEDRIIQQKAAITKAVKNQIQSINGLAALKYLESIGLAENGNITTLASIPFILTLSDGSRIVRAAAKATEEGYIMAYGNIPQGVRVGFSDGDMAFVLQSVQEAAQSVNAARGGNALIFSCIARRWTLGPNTKAEVEALTSALDNSLTYQFAYSGGEICPVPNQHGRLVNQFHNFSLIVCMF
jgi:hypothetical protein